MRSLAAAAAAVTAALLLSSCAGLAADGPVAENSPSAEVAAEAAAGPESVDPLTTCRSFYVGGKLSISKRIKRWGSEVAYPATAENTVELTTIHDRLGGQISDAEPGPAMLLKSVQKPFGVSLDGGSADPADVVEATEVVERMCVDAGYRL